MASRGKGAKRATRDLRINVLGIVTGIRATDKSHATCGSSSNWGCARAPTGGADTGIDGTSVGGRRAQAKGAHTGIGGARVGWDKGNHKGRPYKVAADGHTQGANLPGGDLFRTCQRPSQRRTRAGTRPAPTGVMGGWRGAGRWYVGGVGRALVRGAAGCWWEAQGKG